MAPTLVSALLQRSALRYVAIAAIWAGIFLPGMGSRELQREEGRRILPALAMLQTGDWVFPQLGGVPYRRKPPLVNWLIAASIRITGARSEWACRLPSALAVLALALTILALSGNSGWMGRDSSFVAAIVTMTTVGVWDKGRLAEIEPLYLSLTGIATTTWLAWWARRRSPWLLWIVPMIFIGLGFLAKAPLHLIFFYAVVIGVLGYAKEWRAFFHPAHFVGIAIALGIFAIWAVPYLRGESAALSIWQAQFFGRVTGAFDWSGWALNIPRALLDQLPWLLFAPLLWRPDLPQLGERIFSMSKGVRLAVVATFFGLLLIPGSLPRYTMPLLAPFACLLGNGPRRSPPPAANGIAFVVASYEHRWRHLVGHPCRWRVGATCRRNLYLAASNVSFARSGHRTFSGRCHCTCLLIGLRRRHPRG